MFDIKTVKSFDEWKLNLFEKRKNGYFEFIWRTRNNNWIKWYVEKLDIEPNPENIISISQIWTIVAQIRNNKWYASQNIFSLLPKKTYENLISLFWVSAVNKSINWSFSDWYWNYPTLEKLENLEIQLPTKNWKIDFDFMESFIEEIEKERIDKLSNYLQVSWLKDYNLTEKEKEVLKDFENWKFEWKEFKIEDLFEINTYKKRFDANKVNIWSIGNPYVVRTSLNNWIRGYINEDEEFLNDWNTISFWQDTATMFYQEKPYFTGDKIKILKSKYIEFKKENSQFFITTMSKVFSSFTWGSSSFNIKIIENQNISLPIKDNSPDFELMETLISAAQKLVIKDVVLYADRKIEATKKIVNN